MMMFTNIKEAGFLVYMSMFTTFIIINSLHPAKL